MSWSRTVLVITIIESLLLQQGQAQSSTAQPLGKPSQKLSNALPHVQQQLIQSLDFAYFAEENGMSSTLVLNNNGRQPVEVAVSFYNREGEAYRLPFKTISNESPVRFNLSELLKEAKGNFGTGNLQVIYQGRAMQVTGQITITDEQRHLVFESRMAQPRKSTKLNGLLWFPDQDAKALLALTNIATHPISVNITAAGTQPKKPILLGARETRLLSANDLLPSRAGDKSATLVTLENDGQPEDLLTAGFVFNPKTGLLGQYRTP